MDQEISLPLPEVSDPPQEAAVSATPENAPGDSPVDKEELSTNVCGHNNDKESPDFSNKQIDDTIVKDSAIETPEPPATSSPTLEKTVTTVENEASETPCTEIDNLALHVEKSQTSAVTAEDAVEAPNEQREIVEDAGTSDKLAPSEKFPEDAIIGETEKSVDVTINEESEDGTNKESEKRATSNQSEKASKEDSLPSPIAENSAKETVPSPVTIVEDVESTISSKTKPSMEFKQEANPTSPDSESIQKDIASEKQTVEPENTEFVQITQDKQDDTQNECQPMEAEDPFGEGNLTVHTSELDSPEDSNMNFHKLGDQADNLQDVVNAKDTNLKALKSKEFVHVTEESNPDDPSEGNIENVTSEVNNDETSQTGSKTDTIDAECIIKKALEKSGIDPMIVDCDSESSKKQNDDETESMETDDPQSTVLPGQDDELCIIPDSMKESNARSGESDKAKKATSETVKEKSSKDPSEKTNLEESTSSKEIRQANEASSKDKVSKETKESNVSKESPAKKSTAMTDIIDIDAELKNSGIEGIATKDICKQCNEQKSSNISVKVGTESFNVCSEACKIAFTEQNNKAMDIPNDGVNSKREKRCASCLLIVEAGDERNLSWETMEFCNEECLAKFQTKYGSYCRNCNGSVQPISLGKYCVRFGYDVRQFCCSSCLEDFKKGLKVCSYCQKDISSGTEGFLAPVGDKGQFKDFCTQYCMEKYSRMNSTEPPNVEIKACSVCQEDKVVHCEVQVDRATPVAICSDPCFAAFKFVNNVDPEQCSTCKKFFELANKKSFVVFYESEAHTFCNKTCLNIFIITNRKIVPCNWCKVKKYNFDMIKKELKTGQALMMCSLNCLTLYQVSINAVSAKRISCDFCKDFYQAQYHLTMSDATIRNFCSYDCVMKFQGKYTKSPITIPTSDDPVPTGMPKRTYPPAKGLTQTVQKPNEIQAKKTMPVISSVTSLASLTTNGQVSSQTAQTSTINASSVVPSGITTQTQAPKVIVNQQVITRPPSPVKIHNKMTQCKPLTHTKGVSVRPHPCVKSTQTDGDPRVLVPVPVPIYVPVPVHMWSMPYPVPIPFPLPIPVPIFIPTTRNSAKGIFKDIKRIQEKIPADPFEAELLMMAEMVATEKKTNDGDSDSSDDNGPEPAEPVDSSNAFGEDMLQMALKMATGELDEPAVDLETALTPNTITATQPPSQPDSAMDADVQPERLITGTRGKKRMVPYKPRSTPSKRGRRISGTHDVPMMPPPDAQAQQQQRMMEPIEKPDANMALKYTFGVNAWRQWVVAKNTELEKQITPTRKVKLFKTDLLQLTADELNYTLCLFVKEVRKPNGAEYAPDTIYYLCLGIQQYLFENNRIDNIFTDSYYEKFTDCLNEVAKKFSVLYNEAQYIVTRVEEEHLWECKQLGAHSPHVLLSTLMFFNTKHFNLVTVEEHMQLSFSHIMKHWKRNPAAQAAAVAGKGPGTRNVLLRFYPPQSALEANSRKKKVYEQQENEENPLRCPVKLYEFYLSKCPESVKTRNDVFYLLPERSCVPDSPVWYSTSALAKEHLVKMLYRVKMVKEINVALLSS